MSGFCTKIIQKLEIYENLDLCTFNSRVKQSRWAYMQWKWFISTPPAHPSGRLCSEALRNYRDRSPHKRHSPYESQSLNQPFQLTSRRKILPAQLLPTKQTDRKQINSQENEFRENRNPGVCQCRVAVPAVPPHGDLDIHYTLASAA